MIAYAWKRNVRKEHLKGMNVPEENIDSATGFVYECFIEEASSIGSLISGELNGPIGTMLEAVKRHVSMYDEKRKIKPRKRIPRNMKKSYGDSGPPFRRGEVQKLDMQDYNPFAETVKELSA